MLTTRSPRKRLSIMVPALNEQGNLAATIKEILAGLKGSPIADYEIIIFDDGSTDGTGRIADKLARQNKKIRVVHNRPNRGIGYCYHKGVKMAKFEYYLYIPGDNQYPAKAFRDSLNLIGKADIVIPFVTNMQIRPISRRLVSYLFTEILNFLFNLKITYYNSAVIHQSRILKLMPLDLTSRFSYQALILVRLVKGGASYIEFGYKMYERRSGVTTAFRLDSIANVVRSLLSLFFELQILKKAPVPLKITKMLTQKKVVR
ncbi:glycosyltransferase family 2 protein [Candidatus Daviesbacteria bacterium]|nr:glycosyltransferase family 2 protein [Candidatus Daviesbacteria bacterium]